VRGDRAVAALVLPPAPESLGAGAADVGAAGPRRGAADLSGAGSDAAPRARQFNVEFRVADATASPYLALAMLVQAGLDGIRAAAQDRANGRKPLPDSLGAALDAAGASEAAAEWLGADVLAAYLLFKRAEIKAWKPR
jgi:glutamine synthetase